MAIGFLTAPLVSMISGAIEMNRVMFAIPFGVLVAAYGVHMMLRARPVRDPSGCRPVPARHWRGSLPGSIPVTSADTAAARRRGWQATFARPCARSWRRPTRNRGPIYISQEIDWVHRTWRFYAIADGRMDLIDRTSYFLETPPADAAPGRC